MTPPPSHRCREHLDYLGYNQYECVVCYKRFAAHELDDER